MARQVIRLSIPQNEIQKLEKEFDNLRKSFVRQILVDSLKESVKPVLAATQELAAKRSGQLKRSLGIKTYNGASFVGARVLARRSRSTPGGYYSHLIEKGHRTFIKLRGGVLREVSPSPAKPFMKPAFERTYQSVISDVIYTTRKRLKAMGKL